MKLIELNMRRIIDLCKQYKVDQLFVFGSILTNKFREDSDVDLVVNFLPLPPEDYADNYLSLKEALSQLFQRPVDLIEEKGIRNMVFRQNVNRTKQLIYG